MPAVAVVIAIVLIILFRVLYGTIVWICKLLARLFRIVSGRERRELVENQRRDRARHEQWLLEERQKEREKQEDLRERESIAREYKELVEKFAKLLSNGSSPWDEMQRTCNALGGTSTESTPFRDAIHIFIIYIIRAFSVANGSTPNGLGRMFHILTVTGREGRAHAGIPGNFICSGLRRTSRRRNLYAEGPPWTIAKCVEESIRWIEEIDHTPPDVPSVVKALREFDNIRKTHLAADAADAYYSLVIRASECCSASMAVDALRTKYFTLLQPYISAGFNHDRESSSGKFNGNCTECRQYYAVLRIPVDASEEAVKNAYRNFAKIYHPDRFEGKSERQTAEGEMKQLNVAYKHIMEHFECVKA
jgi:hypothetical protein